MAALDFPASPTVGQIFAAPNSVNYQWTGSMWITVGGVITPSPGGDFFAINTTGAGITTSFGTVTFPTVVTGNTGGNYNPATGAYQPPAGRYRLSASGNWYTSAGGAALNVRIRKNGVVVAPPGPAGGSGSANFFAYAMADVLVDANGSDVFDVQMASGGGGITSVGTLWFLAYPISGIKGPPGDPLVSGYIQLRMPADVGIVNGSGALTFSVVDENTNAGSFAGGLWTPTPGKYFCTLSCQCSHNHANSIFGFYYTSISGLQVASNTYTNGWQCTFSTSIIATLPATPITFTWSGGGTGSCFLLASTTRFTAQRIG